MSATEKATSSGAAVKVPADSAIPAKTTPAARKAPLVARKATKPATKAAARPIAKPTLKTPAKPAVEPPEKPVIKPKAVKLVKEKKPKLVRDSFTIPKTEYTVLGELKQRADKLASPAKKSELLRAGIKALAAMADSAFLAALKAVPAVKTGRPAKD